MHKFYFAWVQQNWDCPKAFKNWGEVAGKNIFCSISENCKKMANIGSSFKNPAQNINLAKVVVKDKVIQALTWMVSAMRFRPLSSLLQGGINTAKKAEGFLMVFIS